MFPHSIQYRWFVQEQEKSLLKIFYTSLNKIFYLSHKSICVFCLNDPVFDVTLIRCTIDSFLTIIRCGKVTENRWYYKS